MRYYDIAMRVVERIEKHFENHRSLLDEEFLKIILDEIKQHEKQKLKGHEGAVVIEEP